MRFPRTPVLAVLLLSAAFSGAQAADDSGILQLATCEESWLEFRDDPAKVARFFGPLQQQYRQADRDGSVVPIKPTTLVGLKVSRLYPESVGMALGFSVIVEAGFDATKRGMEKQMGKSFERCAEDEGMKSCELRIAPKKTVVVLEGERGRNAKSDAGPSQVGHGPLGGQRGHAVPSVGATTLLGCYYYYEK